MEDSIVPYLPTNGIFAKFITYTSGGEICPRYRFFSLAGALGSIIRRKVYFQRSKVEVFPTLFPNMWIILVGPQGRGHKSTALRLSRNFLTKLTSSPRILASKLTPEALAKALSSPSITQAITTGIDSQFHSMLKKEATGLLYSSELGVLLGKEKYNQGMIPLLTDLYDCPDEWFSDTIMRGDQCLYNVCLSIMGASTPDWMQSMLPPDVFKGGFMSRLLLISLPPSWFIRIGDPPPPDDLLRDSIFEDLNKLDTIQGEIKWTPLAKTFFLDWYHALIEPNPGPKAGYLERKQDHLLRLAILLQLGDNFGLTLERHSLERSLNILEAVESDTLDIIEIITTDPRMRIAQKVLELLKVRNFLEADLLNELWAYLSKPTELEDVMTLLIKSKKVKPTLDKAGIIYSLIKGD